MFCLSHLTPSDYEILDQPYTGSWGGGVTITICEFFSFHRFPFQILTGFEYKVLLALPDNPIRICRKVWNVDNNNNHCLIKHCKVVDVMSSLRTEYYQNLKKIYWATSVAILVVVLQTPTNMVWIRVMEPPRYNCQGSMEAARGRSIKRREGSEKEGSRKGSKGSQRG